MKNSFYNFIQKLSIHILEFVSEVDCYDETIVSKGDVVWCLMPLSDEKLMQIPPGHRIRPFVIIENDSSCCSGYACSSKFNNLSISQYRIDKNKYHIHKSSYADVSHQWEIPYKNIQSYYFKLDEHDFSEMINFSKSRRNNIHIPEFGKGTMIQRANRYFLIYGIDKDAYLAVPLKSRKQGKTKNSLLFSYKEEIYYLDFIDKIKITDIQNYSYCSQIPKEQIKAINNKHKELQKESKIKTANEDLSDITLKFPIGTLFYEDFQGICFVYLYHRKNRAYFAFVDRNQGYRYILKKMNLEFLKSEQEICEYECLSDILFDLSANREMLGIVKFLQEKIEQQDSQVCV